MNSVILAEPSTIALAGMVIIFLLVLAVVAGTAVVLIVYFSRQRKTPVTNPPSAAAPSQILPRKCPQCGAELKPDAPEGLCPACLLQRGIATEGAPPPGQPGFVPPPVAEIARLFPQLEILGLIGKGGMGAVYKARQPGLDRFVALKLLPPTVASDPGFAERFNREARTLARLNHPNIVGIYDFGSVGQASRLSPSETQNAKSEAGGLPVPLWYLLMEFVDGTNLREIEGAGKLSPEQALAIVPQICEALQFAHNEGIVHRDIKPENLLLDKKGRVKITDFGIAKIVGAPAGKVSLTGARDVVGTPHYMAPEQIEKPLTVDHRADIYSLGVVFYEMLTGELPLGKFQPPSRKVQIDVRLDEVVLRALEKEPELRYQQASEVKTEVETIVSGGSISSQQPNVRFELPMNKSTLQLVLAGGAACVLIVIAWLVFPGKSGPPRIVSIFPTNGATDVSPDLAEIHVVFDRPMLDRSWSMTGNGAHFPEGGGTAHYDAKCTTWIAPVKLKPGWRYEFGLNSHSYQNFKSAKGVPLEPVYVTFQTSGQSPKPSDVPPKVVSMTPANGATGVDPNLKEIKVVFDEPMADGSWSMCDSDTNTNFPAGPGPVHYDDTRIIWTAPVYPLRRATTYEFWLNWGGYRNFRSAKGVSLDPVDVTFTTAP